MRTPPLLADFIHSRACKPICAKSLTLPNSTAGTPIFLSVACSVVNALTTYFNQAKTSRKAKQNRPFQLKRAVFVELLPRFELGTSSLPSVVEPSSPCCIRLFGGFLSKKDEVAACLFHCFHPRVSPCGSRCGSNNFQDANEGRTSDSGKPSRCALSRS